MKAVVCKAWGGPETLVVEEVMLSDPGPGEVRIRVRAAGVNFPDVLIIQNKYQMKPALPFSPGAEVAGGERAADQTVDHHHGRNRNQHALQRGAAVLPQQQWPQDRRAQHVKAAVGAFYRVDHGSELPKRCFIKQKHGPAPKAGILALL